MGGKESTNTASERRAHDIVLRERERESARATPAGRRRRARPRVRRRRSQPRACVFHRLVTRVSSFHRHLDLDVSYRSRVHSSACPVWISRPLSIVHKARASTPSTTTLSKSKRNSPHRDTRRWTPEPRATSAAVKLTESHSRGTLSAAT